jgi:hypothetical protein
MNRRLLLLFLAAVVILALVLYPSQQCHVTEAELKFSPLKAFVIPVQEGYAVGFSFNVTNQAGCQVEVRSMHVVLRSLSYADGTQAAQNLDETEAVGTTLPAGQEGLFSHSFNSYMTYRPAKLNLRVEMTFAETGTVLVFDGELDVPR